ncbi:Eco57I restriction-modification methylase domain-containing protein [Enterococcus cecorum]|nr:Eco57I restriction-modification methylase domain-containing protein [Enterococcus cecorum]CAI3393359.1 Eco57I restriction-modification methylase domain-containing protein [Enterococcus cecorum]CAI3433009.1 Eco57I restriction-modification methylase domain-containing protein [Enterococcus cecorum]
MEDKFQFDVIIGNPPYQEEAKGDSTQTPPIYHLFMEEAYNISPIVSFITPARFLFNAGATPKKWNQKMLNDPHFKIIDYIQDSSVVFPTTDIKGGVAISYRSINQKFEPVKDFTPYYELNNIFRKVLKLMNHSIDEIMYGQNTYKFTKLIHEDNPDIATKLSKGHKYDLTTSVFKSIPEVFYSDKISEDYIGIIGIKNHKRKIKYIKKAYIINHENLEKYKVMLPKANGSGSFGEALSSPLVAEPLVGHTQSFISIGKFDTVNEAKNVLKYLKTKFTRALLGVLKITQDNPPQKWKYVPMQDFTDSSDIDWSKSISDIDQQLYRKYGLSDEEIQFIEEKVRSMEDED